MGAFLIPKTNTIERWWYGRSPDERYDQALKLFRSGKKLIEIANQLIFRKALLAAGRVLINWITNPRVKKANVRINIKGGQPGNKNAVGNDGGAPLENKNAEKQGFFTKWLPEETMQIMQSIQRSDPLDLLWDNIQL